MSPPVVEAHNLGKRYLLGKDASRHRLADLVQSRRAGVAANEFWALRGISFRINRGDSVGIVGRNGAGKSTLLKLLARITSPSEGEARVRGRVGTLLEVGTGFHPELSGRDNVFLSGAIMGLAPSQIRAKFDEIVRFSGVEKFVDTPVKRYSTGMQMRLAFSVALNLSADILIVDEVLAVGDLEFQRRSMQALQRAVQKDGRTVLFVTHSLGAVQNFCNRVIVLEEGRLEFEGLTEEGLEFYRNSVPLQQESLRDINLVDRLKRTSGAVRCTSVNAFDNSGVARWSFQEGETVRFRIEYEVVSPIPSLTVGFRLIIPKEDLFQREEKIVTNVYETISRVPLPQGYRGQADIVLRDIKFRSLSATPYIWFAGTEEGRAYDVVDTNADLPVLFVRPRQTNKVAREGLVSLTHSLRGNLSNGSP